MTMNLRDYAPDWKLRSKFVRFYRAGGRCEWCGAEHLRPHPVTGSKVVLTTAHVHDKDTKNCSLLNLAALCQRCHLRHDRFQHSETARRKRAEAKFGANGENINTPTEFLYWCILTAPETQKQVAKSLGLSTAQLSQKLNKSNNTQITLDEAFEYMGIYGDTRLLDYLYYTLKIKKSLSDDEIDKQIARLEALRGNKQ